MTEQLRLGEKPSASSRPRSVAQTPIGSVGSIDVELVLLEEADGRDIETVDLLVGNGRHRIPVENVEALRELLERALTSSARRRARRAAVDASREIP